MSFARANPHRSIAAQAPCRPPRVLVCGGRVSAGLVRDAMERIAAKHPGFTVVSGSDPAGVAACAWAVRRDQPRDRWLRTDDTLRTSTIDAVVAFPGDDLTRIERLRAAGVAVWEPAGHMQS